MNSYIPRHDATQQTLRQLEQFPTLSPFCRMFYRYIYGQFEQGELDARKLEQAFHIFLRCECRRHAAVAHIVNVGRLDLTEIIRVARAAQTVLDRLRQALDRTEVPGKREMMIRELVRAECHYHLGRTEDVVAGLRRAIALGGDHPLTYFALGYNLYVSAMQRFTRAGPRRGELIAHDPAAFGRVCRESIAAFEKALGSEGFDAQVHWWIGLIWEMLGEREQARGAFKAAMEIDPDNFANQAIEKFRGLDAPPRMKRSASESARLARLQPITDDDLRQTREFLARHKTFPML